MKQQAKQNPKIAVPIPAEKSFETNYSLRQLAPYILGILAVTFICFVPVFNNELIFWDDPEYTFNNPYIKDISLGTLFSTYYLGNYHPLTMFSFCLEYKFFGINAQVFHFDNLLLHLVNTALVFIFSLRLLKLQIGASIKATSANGLILIPAITAILFGVHPMHVESVAWASERKDVLYSFFFLLSLIGYVKYVQSNFGYKYLFVAFLCYVLSLFSKGQAVVLPLAFLTIDYYLKRKINARLILEKIPFLVLSVIFGLVAIKAQQAVAAIKPGYADHAKFLFTSAYGLFLYLYKSIVPLNLSGLYPYPGNSTGGISPFIYATPLVIVALIYLVWRGARKHRFIGFGVLFFLATISIVLKIIPVGDALIAERYTYLPYVGIFFIFGCCLNMLITKYSQYKTLLYAGSGIIIVSLCALTFQRCFIWRDSFSFWGDVAEKYPNYWRPYDNIGEVYLKDKQYKEALPYFSKAIESDVDCPPVPYLWRGKIYLDNLSRNDLALADFKRVTEFPNKQDPLLEEGFRNLGITYYRSGLLDSADHAYQQALLMNKNDAETYELLGLVYAKKNDTSAALDNYARALQLNPGKEITIETLNNRGTLYTDVLEKYDLAIADFRKILELSPGNSNAILNTGVTYFKKGDYDNAIKLFNSSLQQTNNADVLYLRGLCLAQKGDYASALKDVNLAKSMGKPVDENQTRSWELKLKH